MTIKNAIRTVPSTWWDYINKIRQRAIIIVIIMVIETITNISAN